jgi:hypothetical protein
MCSASPLFPTELGLKEGETVQVMVKDGDWWFGKSMGSQAHGWFPRTYVSSCDGDEGNGIEALRGWSHTVGVFIA